MLKRKDVAANKRRLRTQGLPFCSKDDGQDDVIYFTKTIRRVGEEVRRQTAKNQHLETRLANEPPLMESAMMVLGVSKESVKALHETLRQDDGFGKATERVKKYVKYDSWRNKSNSLGENDPAKSFGLAKLLLNAKEKFPELIPSFPDFRCCDYRRLKDLNETPSPVLETLITTSLRGSRSATAGFRKQQVLRALLACFDIETKETVVSGSHSTYDLTNDRFAAEVSYPKATGGDISQKTSRLASEAPAIRANKGKNYILIYVGGGTGLTQRNGDLNKLAETMDYCFGPTENQAIAFVKCVANEIYGQRITTDEIRRELLGITE
jgi:hypothetical protein